LQPNRPGWWHRIPQTRRQILHRHRHSRRRVHRASLRRLVEPTVRRPLFPGIHWIRPENMRYNHVCPDAFVSTFSNILLFIWRIDFYFL
jgi:hypothetical protein